MTHSLITREAMSKHFDLLTEEAVAAYLVLEGYGDQGTEYGLRQIRMIRDMDSAERITKVELLELHDRGKPVAIRERTVEGVLTDIFDVKKNGEYFLAIDGGIYKAHRDDLVIVREPNPEPTDSVNVFAESENFEHIGMSMVKEIRVVQDCVEVIFTVNGEDLNPFCSHMTVQESNHPMIPNLRVEE